MSNRVILLTDDAMRAHKTGPNHPERPERLEAISNRLMEADFDFVEWRAPSPAARELVERIHEPALVERVESLRGESGSLELDTPVSPGTVEAAYLAAGAAVEAVELVDEDARLRPFALVRPPGHHAESGRSMGFCLFNNIAIAAAHATAALGYERVLVVDWDVHHGNGTHYSFYDRADVLVFNSHRSPFYPGTGDAEETGRGDGAGYTVNVPLPPSMGDGDHRHAFETILEPIADSYEPDLVLVSAGFDSHSRDPLGGMNVTAEGFGALCTMVRDIADSHADGRLALFLEGGYDLRGLGESVHRCVQVLGGASFGIDGESSKAGRAAIERARCVQAGYWSV